MTVATITTIEERPDGSVYVVAEFRADAADRDPIHIEDFHLIGVLDPRPRLVTDNGRVRIGGEWKWPTVMGPDGEWTRRPDLDQADTELVTLDEADISDRLSQVLAPFAEKLTTGRVPLDPRGARRSRRLRAGNTEPAPSSGLGRAATALKATPLDVDRARVVESVRGRTRGPMGEDGGLRARPAPPPRPELPELRTDPGGRP